MKKKNVIIISLGLLLLLILTGASLFFQEAFRGLFIPRSVDESDLWIWYLSLLANGLLLLLLATGRQLKGY